MDLKKKFSESDLQRIKDAVKKAEEKISGEIVPVIVERSGEYSIAKYKASLIGAALVFVIIIIFDRYIINDTVHTLFYDPAFIFLMVVLGGAIGFSLGNYSDFIKRLLVSKRSLDAVSRQTAENAFLEEQVFNTRQRTGIMIFVSFFEHEVIVMADKGINDVVEQNQWDSIVQEIVRNIRHGKIVEALEDGIQRCGSILLEKGFIKTQDDTNELHDDLRV